MRIIAALIAANISGIRPVFSGGTSLSKGFGLIQRFSEDLDFKAILPETVLNRGKRTNYRNQIVDAIRKGSSEWSLDDDEIESGNEGRFFNCRIAYQQKFAPAIALRPRIRLEICFKPPVLPVEERPLQSFIAKAMRQQPEVPAIACVSPIETAADKLSALTWRVLSRQGCQKKQSTGFCLPILAISTPHRSNRRSRLSHTSAGSCLRSQARSYRLSSEPVPAVAFC